MRARTKTWLGAVLLAATALLGSTAARAGTTLADSSDVRFEASIGSPFKIDFDTGYFPSGSPLQFRAFFFASGGEATALYAGHFTCEWDSASAIPGADLPIILSAVGEMGPSEWSSDGGIRYGARYKVNATAGGVTFRKEDYLPFLPNLDISFPCSVDTLRPFSFSPKQNICAFEFGAAGNCLLLGGGDLGLCYGSQSFDPGLGVDFCIELPEEPQAEENPNVEGEVTVQVRPVPPVALDFTASFGACANLKFGASKIEDIDANQSITSDTGTLSYTVPIPCDFANRSEGSKREHTFTLGPFEMDASLVMTLVARVNPELAACFAELVELSTAPNVGLCFVIPVQIPIADFEFNQQDATFTIPIVDPEVRDITPSNDITTNFQDPVPVTWDTSWGAPDNCNLEAEIFYRLLDPVVTGWTHINGNQPETNDGEAEWDLTGQVFTGCRRAQIRVDLQDPNGKFLASAEGDTFLIDVEPPQFAILLPPPGDMFCPGTLAAINWTTPTELCSGLTPNGARLFLRHSWGQTVRIANGLNPTSLAYLWQVPSNLQSDGAATIVLEIRDAGGAVGTDSVMPIGINGPADVELSEEEMTLGTGFGSFFEGLVEEAAVFPLPCASALMVEFVYKPDSGQPPLGEFLPDNEGEPLDFPGIYPIDFNFPEEIIQFDFGLQLAAPFKLGTMAATQVDTFEARVFSTVGPLSERTDQILIRSASQASVWTDVTTAVLADGGEGRGAVWGDFDRDGDDDLYVSNSGIGANRLYRNDDGGFIDATALSPYAILANADNSQGAAWGDVDNDGHLDLYLTTVFASNRLFRNTGYGASFVDITAPPVDDPAGNARCVSWADADGDGDIDLYVTNVGTNRFFVNDGGVLIDATGPPLDDGGLGLAAAWADYDNDGDSDLFLANRLEPSRLFQNQGGGVFVDVAPGTPLEAPADSTQGVTWGDYDNDEDMDLFVAVKGQNKLFRNDIASFVDVTGVSGSIGSLLNGRGVQWGDFDLDGFLDLYVVNAAATNKLYLNSGGSLFVDASNGPVADTGAGQGMALADYDGDGDLDIYLANSSEPNKLFRNDQMTGHHWIHFDLRSSISNHYGVGARVRIVAGGKVQIREVTAGSGIFSMNSLRVEFGLGTATMVDSVQVRWSNGNTQSIAGLAVDQVVYVPENPGATGVEGADVAYGRRFGLRSNVPNPFNPSTEIRFDLPTAAAYEIEVYDAAGRRVLRFRGNGSVGVNSLRWDGRDDAGVTVGSGVYYYRLQAGGRSATRKMLLVK